jgi:hypothetical protein
MCLINNQLANKKAKKAVNEGIKAYPLANARTQQNSFDDYLL